MPPKGSRKRKRDVEERAIENLIPNLMSREQAHDAMRRTNAYAVSHYPAGPHTPEGYTLMPHPPGSDMDDILATASWDDVPLRVRQHLAVVSHDPFTGNVAVHGSGPYRSSGMKNKAEYDKYTRRVKREVASIDRRQNLPGRTAALKKSRELWKRWRKVSNEGNCIRNE